MIRRIIEETGATIDIEDDGTVLVGSVDGAGGEAARDWIIRLVKRIEVGGVYAGRVTRIIPMDVSSKCFLARKVWYISRSSRIDVLKS